MTQVHSSRRIARLAAPVAALAIGLGGYLATGPDLAHAKTPQPTAAHRLAGYQPVLPVELQLAGWTCVKSDVDTEKMPCTNGVDGVSVNWREATSRSKWRQEATDHEALRFLGRRGTLYSYDDGQYVAVGGVRHGGYVTVQGDNAEAVRDVAQGLVWS